MGMFDRSGGRTYSRSVTLRESAERVWETIAGPYSCFTLLATCTFTMPAAARSPADTDLRCWWGRRSNGAVVGGVFEVVVLEPGRRVRYRDFGPRTVAFEFALEPARKGCRLTVTSSWSEFANARTARNLVHIWIDRLPFAVGLGPAFGPGDPLPLLAGAGDQAEELGREMTIAAPLDVIWAAADDPDGTVLNRPNVVRQWRASASGVELDLAIRRDDDDGQGRGYVTRILRHGPHHVTTIDVSSEVQHLLVSEGAGGRLTTIARWDPNGHVDRGLVDERLGRWLADVKAAAEERASGRRDTR